MGVDLAALGVKGLVPAHDLWARRYDGTAAGRFERTLPAHGSGLYRLG